MQVIYQVINNDNNYREEDLSHEKSKKDVEIFSSDCGIVLKVGFKLALCTYLIDALSIIVRLMLRRR